MSDRTTVQARRSQRAKSSRRGGASGRQLVGEYVGQPAGDAAEAVRRAGLRPGLDRSFGCEAELIGLVVAQEPVAGSDLARNGMVTLYVAAPGSGPVEEEPGASETEAPAQASVTSGLAEIAPVDAAGSPRRARRRKPGLARKATRVFDPPPAPASPQREPEQEVLPAPEWSAPDVVCGSGVEEFDEGPAVERGESEISHEEFVVHLEDVLAGRTGGQPAWRRVYPRRRTFAARARGGRVRVWLGEHSLIAKVLGAALAVCVLVGVASALNAPHPRSDTASVLSPGRQPEQTRATRARRPVSVTSVASARRAARSPGVHTAAGHSAVPRRHPRPAPVVPALSVRMAVQTPPAPPEAPPTPVSVSPPPAPEQTQGGLFSP